MQILLRLGSTFQAHEYLSCIKRLPTRGDAAASDGFMLSEWGRPAAVAAASNTFDLL
jgi:hypothetical protein